MTPTTTAPEPTSTCHSQAAEWYLQTVAPPDADTRELARQRQAELTKPAGALGQLEAIAIDFASWQGKVKPQLENIRIRVFAGDHGIATEGISAFPQSVTMEMIRIFANGGAAISVLSQHLGADFGVISLGTATPVPEQVAAHPRVKDLALAPGTANACDEPAMTTEVLQAALQAGADSVAEGSKPDLFIGGEMGIGNTASTSAIASILLALPAYVTVGRGSGVDDEALAHKVSVVQQAVDKHSAHCDSALETLRRVGGLEIAALAGAYIAAAQRGVPSLIDGFISTGAALVACRINPGVRDWLLFGHRSAEAAHTMMLEALEAKALLDIGMRLGEGSGAAAAVPLLQAACRLHCEMATFAEAGIGVG